MTTNVNSVNLQNSSFTCTGDWAFNTKLNVTTPANTISIQNATVAAPAPPVGGITMASEGQLFLYSRIGDAFLAPQAGNLFLQALGSGGKDITVDASDEILIQSVGRTRVLSSMGILLNNSLGGNLDLITSTGAINIDAQGVGRNINMTAAGDLIVSAKTSQYLSLNNTTIQTLVSGDISLLPAGRLYAQSIAGISMNNIASGDVEIINTVGLINLDNSAASGMGIGLTSDGVITLQTTNDLNFSAPNGSITISADTVFTGIIEMLASKIIVYTGDFRFDVVPGSPPVGSLALLWDPVSRQVFHV